MDGRRDDQEAWVGVLRSTGRIFSAGADLKGGSAAGEWPVIYSNKSPFFTGNTASSTQTLDFQGCCLRNWLWLQGTYHEVPTMNSFESGWEIFKPTVASVQGACIGYEFLSLRIEFLS